MTAYEELRQRQVAQMARRLPVMVERLAWDHARLAAEREAGLRGLLAHAASQSPWHRDRLRGVDVASLTEADLPSLPTMSKDALHEAFDEIVTDRRLTRALVEDHLARLGEGDAYLLDEYHVIATGGSSGRRTLVVWDWDGWVDCFLTLRRRWRVQEREDGGPPVVARVFGAHASHMTAALAHTFADDSVAMRHVPASLPLAEIVRRLNEIQPAVLQGYSSMLHRLALEAIDGRLRIAPRAVAAGSEALLPETRELLTSAWGVPVQNVYAASETGAIATSCAQGPWMHLTDDVLIVEVESDRVLVTNLMNRVMPLIRYELDDRVRLIDVRCPCGSVHRTIADVEGRSTDVFSFSGGASVHPIVFSGSIGSNRGVAEYQVRQTGDALDIDVVPQGDLDPSAVRADVERALWRAGAEGIDVRVRVVDELARVEGTGKARRFIPERTSSAVMRSR